MIRVERERAQQPTRDDKKYHINERNRGGYDVPGFEKALYMFLPSYNNGMAVVQAEV